LPEFTPGLGCGPLEPLAFNLLVKNWSASKSRRAFSSEAFYRNEIEGNERWE
jgi:hypothetical protein